MVNLGLRNADSMLVKVSTIIGDNIIPRQLPGHAFPFFPCFVLLT